MIKVGIIMGSDSDLPIMKESAEILDSFKIKYELTIVSAHRTPKKLYEYATSAKSRGIKIIIAGAGGSAHLPGMIASLTTVPVIGVPIESKSLKGLDSLYSIVQMPPGVPVATMAINGAKNAGLMAIQFLGSFDDSISKKVEDYKNSLETTVLEKASKLESLNYKSYFKELI